MRYPAVLLFLLALLACSGRGDGGPEVSPLPLEVPPEVARNAGAWPLANGDYGGTRLAAGTEISSETIGALEVAWTFDIPGIGAYGAAATNPLILDGVVYFQDLQSNVYALGLEDGGLLWKREVGIPNGGPNGVAAGWGKLFAPKGTAGVMALDLATGEEAWYRELARTDGEGIDIQPLVYGRLVLVSTVPGAGGESFYQGGNTGVIHALDQATGEPAWSFDTVEEGLWGDPAANSGGGAWYPPAVDAAGGMTYWGTANPGPFPGTEEAPDGGSRPGDNPYTNSTLALTAASGELAWHRQARPHDLFDLDHQLAMFVAGAEAGGETRDVVIGGGKAGTVSAYAAADGELLWQTEVGRHENDDLEAVPEGETVTVYPGILGGITTPMAYADGVVYAAVVNNPARFTATETLYGEFRFTGGTGELVALSLADGSVIWRRELERADFGAATVAGDLVLTATYDGTALAFDRRTGKEVWRYQLPAGVNGSPAIAGDTIVWPAGVPLDGATPRLVALRVPGGD